MAEEDVIFDNDDEESENQENKELSLQDLTRSRTNFDYINSEDLDDGVTYEVHSVEQNYPDDMQYTLSGDDVDYNVQIYTTDDRVQTINAWSMYNLFRAAAAEAMDAGLESTSGLHIDVQRVGRGEYELAWSLDGEEWNEVEVEEDE